MSIAQRWALALTVVVASVDATQALQLALGAQASVDGPAGPSGY